MSTTPQVPYRLEFSVELPGTVEQVWHAVATANGLSSWFLPTRLEEREGGALHFSMGPDMGSDGHVTAWEPPHRFEYQEDWAALMGKDPDELSPMTSEFVVEARSGGTCVVRVTTSGFGTGAEWEAEWWQDMGESWKPSFDALLLYLTHFPGQTATQLEVSATHRTDSRTLWAAVHAALGSPEEDAAVELPSGSGVLERRGARHALVRLTGTVPGMLSLYAHDMGEGEALVGVRAHLFSQHAGAHSHSAQPAWREWLEGLTP